MRKRQVYQSVCLCTAVIATVLFVCVSYHLIPVRYPVCFCVLALLLQVIAILLQLHTVRQRYLAYRKAVDELESFVADRAGREHRRFYTFIDTPYIFAQIKSLGINPNRAGPVCAFS